MVNYMQRYEIVNGTVEAEGAAAEVAKTEEGEEESAEGFFFFFWFSFCFEFVCAFYILTFQVMQKKVFQISGSLL